MREKVILTFDKSQNDTPVLCVSEEYQTFLSTGTSMRIKKFITGEDAVKVWELVTGEKLEKEDREQMQKTGKATNGI